jgi:hypothetical protein
MLPVAGLIDQVVVSPEGRFTTENCLVPEGANVAVVGLMLGGAGEADKVMLAVPRTVDELFAVTVMVVCDATLLGAV